MSRLVPVVMLFVSMSALAQGAPDEADLMTVYCIPVLQRSEQVQVDLEKSLTHSIDNLQNRKPALVAEAQGYSIEQLQAMQTAAHEALAETHSSLGRLQSYLSPRLDRLDVATIAAVQRRADADWISLDNPDNLQRVGACSSKCVDGSGIDQECVASCLGPKLAATRERIVACANPTWLPF
jgi:hypothetical protein